MAIYGNDTSYLKKFPMDLGSTTADSHGHLASSSHQVHHHGKPACGWKTDGGNADVGSICLHASMCAVDHRTDIFGHQNLPYQSPCGSLYYGSGTVDPFSHDMAFSVT